MISAYNKYKILIPISILSVFCISTFVNYIFETTEIDGEFYRYKITNKHYGAFIMVTIGFITFFYLRPLYKYILLFTLILGFFNLINFTLFERQQTIGVGSLRISFQLIPFFVGLLTVIIGYKRIIEIYVIEFGKSPEQILIDDKKQYNDDIYKFKNIYKNKTPSELIQILEDKRYTESALEAAKQLLNEKNSI